MGKNWKKGMDSAKAYGYLYFSLTFIKKRDSDIVIFKKKFEKIEG